MHVSRPSAFVQTYPRRRPLSLYIYSPDLSVSPGLIVLIALVTSIGGDVPSGLVRRDAPGCSAICCGNAGYLFQGIL
jgi:hypothetical protein